MNVFLYGNSDVTHNGNALFFSHWAQSGLRQVKDVWHEETNDWRTGQYIFNHLARKNNWIAEFESIKKGLPTKWKQTLQGQNVVVHNEQN